MKILHVYKVYLPENFTGIPRVIHTLAEGLTHKGVESHVLTLAAKGRSEPEAIGSHYAHYVRRDLHIASASLSASAFGRFRQLAKSADVIHYHLPWPLADILHLAAGRKKPSVATYHSDIVKQRLVLPIYSRLLHPFLRKVDAIVATSSNYAETSEILAKHRSRVSIIPIGIGEREEPEPNQKERWRARFGDSFFLFVGSLRYYKGLPFLIEAARRTGLPVVIAGSRDLADFDIHDVPENVHFSGEVSEEDKEALLSLCQAFVFPSHLRSEAFGVALLEAARAAKPMISCEIGTGTSFVNIAGETGLVIAPRDPEALGGAMTWLAHNPQEAQKMGANARRRFERLFRAEDMCAAYLRLYHRVVATHRQ
ncbi:glycosyltransferase [Neoaquamicrobium microcysteis]|nr:glycosyltransferase [Mesorhizobium microcysteis]